MKKRDILIFDTTLRDGTQAKGVSFSSDQKLFIANQLSELGFSFIEAGSPQFNEKDYDLFKQLPSKIGDSSIVAFARTCEETAFANEFGPVINSNAGYVAVVGKSSVFHVLNVLKKSLDDNLRMIGSTVTSLCQKGIGVIFDAEHFFDAYIENKEYAFLSLKAAVDAGAFSLTLCDTNGGRTPEEIYRITKDVVKTFGKQCKIGIHCHNDCGMATANSLSAVKAGATLIQGTMLGIGERCGNANLVEIISNLQLKYKIKVLKKNELSKLTRISHIIAQDCSGINIEYMPFVGKNAFSHKAGMHIDGIIKAPSSFEHIDPLLVGNKRSIVISELSGVKAIKFFVSEKLALDINDSKCREILLEIKKKEKEGFDFQTADATLVVLMLNVLGKASTKSEPVIDGFFNRVVSFDALAETDISKVTIGNNVLFKVRLSFSLSDGIHVSMGIGNDVDHAMMIAFQDYLKFKEFFEKRN